jgi:diadenosine tetraphosphate (Ap4A) HIT family hydrolase
MNNIFETDNFKVIAADPALVTREEGGHIVILPKFSIPDRTQLTPAQASEYMKLSMVVGEALKNVLAKQGIDIGIVNYQDMGNWRIGKPEGLLMHMNIFGRATNAVIQKYGDAVQLPRKNTGFYDKFEPLNENDKKLIKEEIERLLASDKYKNW